MDLFVNLKEAEKYNKIKEAINRAIDRAVELLQKRADQGEGRLRCLEEVNGLFRSELNREAQRFGVRNGGKWRSKNISNYFSLKNVPMAFGKVPDGAVKLFLYYEDNYWNTGDERGKLCEMVAEINRTNPLLCKEFKVLTEKREKELNGSPEGAFYQLKFFKFS